MKAPVQIETARLILRQPQVSDAAAMFGRYASDPEVTRFVGWPRHRSVRDTEAFLQFSALEWEQWPAGPFLIISGADGQLLGSTGLGFQAPDEAMTGYVLAKDAWGKGYATEALAAMIETAARIGVSRLSAICHPEHPPRNAFWRSADSSTTRRLDRWNFQNCLWAFSKMHSATPSSSKRGRVTRANIACSRRGWCKHAPPRAEL